VTSLYRSALENLKVVRTTAVLAEQCQSRYESPILISVKSSAPIDQLANGGRTFLGENTDSLVPTQAIAHHYAVSGMTLRGISVPDNRCDSPLCLDGNACSGTGLLQDQHLADLGELDYCPDRRDAATVN